MSRVKIVTFVPPKNADAVRKAIGLAGAGELGEYTFCSYSTDGVGRYLPSSNADPHIGKPGKFESTNEQRVEVTCDRRVAKRVIKAMKEIHPYEEVAFDIYPLIAESEL